MGYGMKKVLYLVLFVVLSFTSLDAAAYKGQRVFAKKCVKCHGQQDFIQGKTRREWKKILKNKGKKLAQIHLESKKAKKVGNILKVANLKEKVDI